MELRQYICWGALGHAKVLYECLSYDGFQCLAVFDNNSSSSSPFRGISIYHGKTGLEKWRLENPGLKAGAVVAIGGAKGLDRLNILNYLQQEGFEILSPKHPSAFIAKDASIGAGTHILAQAAICSEAKIGNGCIVNTAAVVDHECILEDGVHIAPGARLAGNVTVGTCSLIGIGACVAPKIKIGAYVTVGVGAVVIRDIPDYSVVVGNPARIIKKVEKNNE